jgi:hypothetical protein
VDPSNEAIRQSKENRIKLKRAMDSLETELRYFVNRTEKGGIKEHDILEYHHTRVSDLENNILFISKLYADIREYEETKEILGLIKKYCELTNKKRSRQKKGLAE